MRLDDLDDVSAKAFSMGNFEEQYRRPMGLITSKGGVMPLGGVIKRLGNQEPEVT